MRIAGASKGGASEGAVPRWYRPPTFESSFLFLPVARPPDSRPRTRPRRSEGRRLLGCPLLSSPGDGTGRAQSCGSGSSPAGSGLGQGNNFLISRMAQNPGEVTSLLKQTPETIKIDLKTIKFVFQSKSLLSNNQRSRGLFFFDN